MGQVNTPSNLLDRIKRLERQYQQLWKSLGLTSATIEKGGLTLLNDAFLQMIDDNGDTIVYIGPDGQGKQIIRVRREGGAYVLYTYTAAGGLQFWALTDNAGRIIVSDDAESGTGLARPWLPVPLYPMFAPSVPVAGDTGRWAIDSAEILGETTLWEGRASVSHPWIQIDGTWGHASGSGAITYRLRVSGQLVGSWVETGGITEQRGPFSMAGHIGTDWAPLTLTAQTNGTGAVWCAPQGCYLRQT
ncbi:hypothetical protein [Actinophytocola sediminis]